MVEYEWSREFCRDYAEGLRPVVKLDHGPLARKIATYLDSRPTQTVVDIATGPGYLLLELAKLMQSPRLIAQDAHPGMLEIAQEEAEKYGQPIRLCECPAEELALEDGSADVVLCKQLLHEVNDPEKVVSEICRVVKPGGQAFIIDFDAEGSRLAAQLIRGLLRITSGKFISDNFWKSFGSGLSGRTVVEYLRKYGLQQVEYQKRGPNYFLVGRQ